MNVMAYQIAMMLRMNAFVTEIMHQVNQVSELVQVCSQGFNTWKERRKTMLVRISEKRKNFSYS